MVSDAKQGDDGVHISTPRSPAEADGPLLCVLSSNSFSSRHNS